MSLALNYNKMVYGIQRKVHVSPYVNWALLLIIMAENWNFLITFVGSLSQQMLRKFVQWFRP
jgi:hypothetical protein